MACSMIASYETFLLQVDKARELGKLLLQASPNPFIIPRILKGAAYETARKNSIEDDQLDAFFFGETCRGEGASILQALLVVKRNLQLQM